MAGNLATILPLLLSLEAPGHSSGAMLARRDVSTPPPARNRVRANHLRDDCRKRRLRSLASLVGNSTSRVSAAWNTDPTKHAQGKIYWRRWLRQPEKKSRKLYCPGGATSFLRNMIFAQPTVRNCAPKQCGFTDPRPVRGFFGSSACKHDRRLSPVNGVVRAFRAPTAISGFDWSCN
ncbi:hypothetical protein K0M31_002167 [Melipona bicolor]|uniref:Secreted protein n=1 Tax=Melipona bicolor TaxID=60889 RepID=A0AA40GH85_9HYME|nr:hypothetical protein K0M31_002167 [Melipona bicolor]